MSGDIITDFVAATRERGLERYRLIPSAAASLAAPFSDGRAMWWRVEAQPYQGQRQLVEGPGEAAAWGHYWTGSRERAVG